MIEVIAANIVEAAVVLAVAVGGVLFMIFVGRKVKKGD